MQQTQRIALANQQQARTELITDMMLVDMELVGDFGASGQIATDWESMNPQQKSLGKQGNAQDYREQFFQNEISLTPVIE